MLNQRLELLRKEKHLTKKQVADFLKIDQSTYGKYELNKREPDFDTLQKLADFYDVSVDFLLGRTDIRNYHVSEAQSGYMIDVSGLPEEIIKQAEDYIEYLKQKYNQKKYWTIGNIIHLPYFILIEAIVAT